MLIGLALTFFSLSVYFGKKGLKTLIDNNQLPLIILTILGLIIAWNFRAFMSKSSAEAMVGLSFHFFGASLLVVMFGLWEAIALLFITSLFAVLLVKTHRVYPQRLFPILLCIFLPIALGICMRSCSGT